MSLRVEVGRLLRRPGRHQRFDGVHEIAELRLGDAGVSGDLVGFDLELLGAEGDEVVVTGVIEARWGAQCRRCLDPITIDLSLDVDELFERDPVEGETYPIGVDDWVDLEPVAREAILLAVPVAPLCGEDCSGPEPDRFPTGQIGEDDQDRERPRDPRWAALDELRSE